MPAVELRLPKSSSIKVAEMPIGTLFEADEPSPNLSDCVTGTLCQKARTPSGSAVAVVVATGSAYWIDAVPLGRPVPKGQLVELEVK